MHAVTHLEASHLVRKCQQVLVGSLVMCRQGDSRRSEYSNCVNGRRVVSVVSLVVSCMWELCCLDAQLGWAMPLNNVATSEHWISSWSSGGAMVTSQTGTGEQEWTRRQKWASRQCQLQSREENLRMLVKVGWAPSAKTAAMERVTPTPDSRSTRGGAD